MVFNRQLIAALGVERAHLVLDFLESAFDFPAGRVVFDHLFGGEFKIGREQRKRERAVVDENDFDRAFQRAGHANEFGKTDLSHFSIEMNLRASCLAFELCGKFRDGGKPVAIFWLAPAPSDDVFWKVVKDGGDSHSGKEFDFFRNVSANLPQKRQSPEPAVADDQGGVFEAFDHSDDQFGADAGFGFEPFGMRQFCAGFHFVKQRHIESLSKRQARPASVNELQNPGDDAAMSPDIFGRVGPGGMVKMSCASVNVPSGVTINGVVESDKNPSSDCRIAEQTDDHVPKVVPGDLGGVDEIVKPFDRVSSREDIDELAENAADSARLPAGRECGDQRSENGLAIGGDNRCDLIKKFVEFHIRLLSFVGYAGNIAQTSFRSGFLSVYNQQLAT